MILSLENGIKIADYHAHKVLPSHSIFTRDNTHDPDKKDTLKRSLTFNLLAYDHYDFCTS